MIDLIILILATYRLSIMIHHGWEVGPFGILKRLRQLAGAVYTGDLEYVTEPGTFADGLTCIYCNSVWIGLLLACAQALLASWLPAQLALLALAASGGHVIVAHFTGES